MTKEEIDALHVKKYQLLDFHWAFERWRLTVELKPETVIDIKQAISRDLKQIDKEIAANT